APDVGFELVRLKRDDAPAALLTLRASTISSGNFTTLKLDMTYRDEDKVNVGSLDDKDMQIRLPDGSTRKARLVSVNKPTNGAIRHAIYKFTAPGGSWDPADNGMYRVRLRGGQVFDAQQHASAA